MGLRLQEVRSLADARPAWTALAEAGGNPFATWEWASAWWDAWGAGRRLLLYVARRDDGEPAAILPLYLSAERPVRLVRFIGHGPADQLGPVCAPRDRREVAAALRRLARERLGLRTLLLAERLPGSDGWAGLLRAPVLRRERSPVLEIAGHGWDAWLANRSANFRQQVRRRERKLVREHGLRFELVTDPAQLQPALGRLITLHDARWQGASNAFDSRRAGFHHAFAELALARGWLRLWLAHLDDEPVAAWLGFRFAGSDWYYQAGRSPAWESSGVGSVLLLHTIRDAFEAGMREYRFGLGDEPYKARLTTADPGLETVAVGSRPVVLSAAAAARAATELPKNVRGRLLRPLASSD
jgi:CelD/BcsL family acetyltransferase involved in cellulose biosynthesis